MGFLLRAAASRTVLRSGHVGFHGFDRFLQDQLHAQRRGEVKDEIRPPQELLNSLPVLNFPEVKIQQAGGFQVLDILQATCGKIVEHRDVVVALNQPLCQMRTDESRAARDQKPHSQSPRLGCSTMSKPPLGMGFQRRSPRK